MVKWNSIHGHPHTHGVTHTNTVYVHAKRVYSHPTTEHPTSPPSSQVPHSCSAYSACSVGHTIHGITLDCKHPLHNTLHFLFQVEQCPWIPTVHGVTHATHNTPLPTFRQCSVTSSSDSLWCVSTSYTNSKVKGHSHAHIAQMVECVHFA